MGRILPDAGGYVSTVLLGLTTWAFVATSATAQDAPPSSTGPAQTSESGQAARVAGARLAAGPDGFSIESPDGDYRLELRGYAQFDGRLFPGDGPPGGVDTFVLRRVRPVVQGRLGWRFEFRLMPDFGQGETELLDAYLDVRLSSALRLRVGLDKSPVGLERLQSAAALAFVERAYPTAVVPNRDLGVRIHGEFARGVVAYDFGLFNGAPDGGSSGTDLDDGKEAAGRVFVSPFSGRTSALAGLGLGIAGTVGNARGGALPGYRSAGQTRVVSLLPGVVTDGRRTRVSPQLSFYADRVGLRAEYARAESRVGSSGGRAATLEVEAWQATLTVALAGGRPSYRGVRPEAPFDPAAGHWGALELAMRVHALEVGDGVVGAGLLDPERSVRRATSWAVGLNWYLTCNVKQVVDFERTTFTGGAAAGSDRRPENALFVRTQLAF